MEAIEIAIYGASGHGRVVFDVATKMGHKVVLFVDDDRNKKESLGVKVISFDEFLKFPIHCALGIGNNRARFIIYEKLKKYAIHIATLIDPKAIIGSMVNIGEGSVVMPASIINNSAIIGKGCIVNTAAVVEHDCHIGDFSHISPNAALAGGVKVGSFSQIGIGASVRENTKIGDNVIVGAGTVVVNDIPDNVVVVGNPARVLRKNEL